MLLSLKRRDQPTKPASQDVYLELVNQPHQQPKFLPNESRQDLVRKGSIWPRVKNEREAREREDRARREAFELARRRAQVLSREVAEQIQAVNNLLLASLQVDHRIDWESLKDRSTHPAHHFDVPRPARSPYPPRPQLAEPSFLRDLAEWFVETKKEERLTNERKILRAYQKMCLRIDRNWRTQLKAWNAQRAESEKQHKVSEQQFLQQQSIQHQRIDALRKNFEAGVPDAIKEYLDKVLERIPYPTSFPVEHAVAYDSNTRTAIISVTFPSEEVIPQISEYQFIESTGETNPIKMLPDERAVIYRRAIKNSIIRSMHEVFASDYTGRIATVVVKGLISSIDPATGNDRVAHLLTIHIDRVKFLTFNLPRVDPHECIRSLNGRGNPPPHFAVGALPLNLLPPQRATSLIQPDHTPAASRDHQSEVCRDTHAAAILWEVFEQPLGEFRRPPQSIVLPTIE